MRFNRTQIRLLIAIIAVLVRASHAEEPEIHTLLSVGDNVPGFGIVARLDVRTPRDASCMAEDGRVVVLASTVGDVTGLICIDASGPHLVVQSNTLAPDGYRFLPYFGQCHFTDGGALTFEGERGLPQDGSQSVLADASIYLASDAGIMRLFGDGMEVSNRTTIEDRGSNVFFTANSRGSILARTHAEGDALFLSHDGQLDAITYRPPVMWALADDDTVVALDRANGFNPDPQTRLNLGNVIVAYRDGQRRVVFEPAESLPPEFYGFGGLAVRGDLAFFYEVDRDRQPLRSFTLRLGESQATELAGAINGEATIDFTRGGRFLQAVEDGFAVFDSTGTRSRFLSGANLTVPFAVNDRGNVALIRGGYSTSFPQVALLTGPLPDAAASCPQVPLTPQPTPTATAKIPRVPLAANAPERIYTINQDNDSVSVFDRSSFDILRRTVVSRSPTLLQASPDGRRLFVLAGNRVDIMDATTLEVIRTLALGEGGTNITAADDNNRAFITFDVTNAGTSWVTGLARTAVVDATTDFVTSVLAPDQPPVVDRGRDVPPGFARPVRGDAIVAQAPQPPMTTPTPTIAQVVLRPADEVGVFNDFIALVVSIDSADLPVASLDHDLITTWYTPLFYDGTQLPDCRLAPGVPATAEFVFRGPGCGTICDRVHVTIHTNPGSSLPAAGPLYSCTIVADRSRTLNPLIIAHALASDFEGDSLPILGANAVMRVGLDDEATPRVTRTPTVTHTATVTRTPAKPTATATETAGAHTPTATRSPTMAPSQVPTDAGGDGCRLDAAPHGCGAFPLCVGALLMAVRRKKRVGALRRNTDSNRDGELVRVAPQR